MKKRKSTQAKGLIERGLAKASKSGKPALAEAGKKRLKRLRVIWGLRLSRLVLPRKPTRVRKKVLFVCPVGVESAHLGLEMFKEIAQRNPVNVILELDSTGWHTTSEKLEPVMRRAFEKAVLNSDFIVPMLPSAREKVKEVVRKTKFKPLIIDVGFGGISEQYEEKKYEQILETIRKSLEKEKK